MAECESRLLGITRITGEDQRLGVDQAISLKCRWLQDKCRSGLDHELDAASRPGRKKCSSGVRPIWRKACSCSAESESAASLPQHGRDQYHFEDL